MFEVAVPAGAWEKFAVYVFLQSSTFTAPMNDQVTASRMLMVFLRKCDALFSVVVRSKPDRSVRSKAEYCVWPPVENASDGNIEGFVGKDTALRERNRSSPTPVPSENSMEQTLAASKNSGFDRTQYSAFESYTTAMRYFLDSSP